MTCNFVLQAELQRGQLVLKKLCSQRQTFCLALVVDETADFEEQKDFLPPPQLGTANVFATREACDPWSLLTQPKQGWQTDAIHPRWVCR